MHKMRFLAMIPLLLGVASAAFADFDGPAPLAWRWAETSPVPPSGTPLVDGNLIFVGVGSKVFGLDRETGNQRWKYPTTENVDGYFKGTPVLCDGTVVVATDTTVYGFDPASGERKWYYKLTDPQQVLSAPPVGCGKYVVFAVNAEYLYAVNGSDGKETWKQPQHIFDHLVGNLAAIGDNVLFFTQTHNLNSLNVAAPAKIKTLQTFSTLDEEATPVVQDDIVYINSSSYVAALNGYTGSVRWQTDTSEDNVFGPAVSPLGIVTVSRSGIVTIMDPKGKIKSMKQLGAKGVVPMKIDLQSGPVARPSVAGKFFVVPTINGALNVIDPESGDTVWRYVIHPISSEVKINAVKGRGNQASGRQSDEEKVDAAKFTVAAAGPATSVGDTMLVLAADGSLLAFDKNSGVDVTGPEVKMTYPSAGSSVTSQDLPLVFTIADDDSGVNEKTIKVTFNGQEMEGEFTADGHETVWFGPYAKNKLLPDGRTDVAVTVSDWMGNVTNAHFTLIIDNTLPPLKPPASTQQRQGGPGGAGGPGGSSGGGKGGGGGGYGGR